MKTIYLDYNATTPVAQEVRDEMLPYLTEVFGNPSSSHIFGIQARNAIEKAREQVATMLNCQPSEITFTGGGTESNNMALCGVANAYKSRGKHIIISAVEHPAVSEVATNLQNHGFELSIAPVDEFGRVKTDILKSLIRTDTILISVMHANNETGTIQPVSEIAAIAHEYGIIMHTDAAQSIGKVKVDVNELDVDLLSIAGHKLYAPKGIGALYIRRGIKCDKLMYGANHEKNLRPGTENVPYIVALGKACQLITANLDSYTASMLTTKNILKEKLIKAYPNSRINSSPDHCLPNTLNISFRNLSAAAILINLDDVAVSAGAACHSASGKSNTINVMNLPPEYSMGALRISTGRYTTVNEASIAAELIINAVEKACSIKQSGGTSIKLTDYATGLGCGCKMRPADLEYILKDLPKVVSSDVIVGIEHRDDAAVYKISEEELIVQTVDFFTPMVDDPYAFGAIAAANALSDIYAMGAKPVFALNLVAFPVNQLPLDILKEIIRGATDKATEAGIPILGGHSIEDSGIKFGMVVTGRVKSKDLITNAGAKPGDALILTKPLGTGIVTKALKMGILNSDMARDVITVMQNLNKKAAEIMSKYPVNACTDITGFGLTGHLHEMAVASKVDCLIHYDDIPVIEEVKSVIKYNSVPSSTIANEMFAADWADFSSLNADQKALLCDAQTSGGLLISVSKDHCNDFIRELTDNGIPAAVIGSILTEGSGKIQVSLSSIHAW